MNNCDCKPILNIQPKCEPTLNIQPNCPVVLNVETTQRGAPGKDATINGVNTLFIETTDGISYTQSDETLTLSGQDLVAKTETASQVYGTDDEGNQTTYDVDSFGQVDDVQVGGVSVVTNKIAVLGTMASETASDYSTKAVADTLYAGISYEQTIDNHIADKNNPHAVTKAQVGLGNCDNTSDLDKPVSTATQTALNGKQNVLTAGTGINISGNTISVTTPTLTNTATGDDSLTILGSSSHHDRSINIGARSFIGNDTGIALGYGSSAYSEGSISIGNGSSAGGENSIAIGNNAQTYEDYSIQLGAGDFYEAHSFYVATDENKNWKMLGNDGIIPDARISNNIARASDIPTAVSQLTNDSNYQTATQVANSIAVETQNRENADIGLQNQIDAIVSSSDVFDIVGTYAELQAYDITTVPVNDIIKVLVDETHSGAATYYRCVESGGVKSWSYIGSEGAYYTKGEADSTFVPQTRTVNSKALSSNITLTASDVGALPDTTVIPTVNNPTITIQKNGSTVQTFTLNQSSNATANITVPTATSDLTNDSGYLTSADLSSIESDIEDLQDANKVINVVSTYAELQSYNTSTVTKNSIIKVIADETNSGKTSWYQWSSQGAGTAFVQPTLTADGTLGGADFACACDSTYNRGGNPDYAWHAFDGRTNVSTTYPSSFWNSGSGQPHWIEFYNPEPLAVTNIKIYNGESGSVAKDWQFQCSDDNSTWTTLTSGTNTTTGQGADWNFNVTDSGNHKYYRFYTTSSQGQYSAHLTIAEIVITGIVGAGYGWTKIKDEGKYATETYVTSQGYITSADLPTNHVTTDTAQDITGTKTFVGQKKVGFKQSSSSDKLGFTLYNNSNVEKGYLEYNPSNLVDNVPLMTLGNYTSTSAGQTHVGFRKYSGISGESGAYNLLAPLVKDAKTPFSLTTTYTNFYLPLGFTDGSTTVTTAKSGVVDISSFGYTKNIGTVTSVNNTSPDGNGNVSISIPTVNNATLTIQKNSTNVATFTANASSNVTADISVPTKVSDLSNDSGFITGITSGDVTNALGYTPANDSNVVKTSGNQTIDGNKTFTSSLFSNGTYFLVNKLNINRDDTPSSNIERYVEMVDKNGEGAGSSYGRLKFAVGTNKATTCELYAYKAQANNLYDSAKIGIYYPATGNPYTYAPTPATSDDSTKIATTAFVKNQGYKTSISSSDVTNALGYTPYNSSNPSGYLTATESKSGDGYVKLSNGIIIQWGHLTGNTTNVTLPTAFTTTNYRISVVPTPGNGSSTYRAVVDGDSKTTTAFDIGRSDSFGIDWIAIGW